MLLKSLRDEVLQANLELVRRRLVLYTFGNGSGISRNDGEHQGVPKYHLSTQDVTIREWIAPGA
jgi:L-ribulose-5-phosphate 4-epimerase